MVPQRLYGQVEVVLRRHERVELLHTEEACRAAKPPASAGSRASTLLHSERLLHLPSCAYACGHVYACTRVCTSTASMQVVYPPGRIAGNCRRRWFQFAGAPETAAPSLCFAKTTACTSCFSSCWLKLEGLHPTRSKI